MVACSDRRCLAAKEPSRGCSPAAKMVVAAGVVEWWVWLCGVVGVVLGGGMVELVGGVGVEELVGVVCA